VDLAQDVNCRRKSRAWYHGAPPVSTGSGSDRVKCSIESKRANHKQIMDDLKKLIREVPDFPKPGINFYDITTLLKHPEGLRKTVDALAAEYEGAQIDTVVGIEARGFIFAPALAYHLGAGFVPVRKPKKLPAETASISYDLEYGQDTLHIHRDAIGDGHRVLIADDLLATGGTAKAVCDLVGGLGGKVEGLVFVVELEFLPGRKKLEGYDVRSLIKYQS
jgi:adenine phosphoribosyltransferase